MSQRRKVRHREGKGQTCMHSQNRSKVTVLWECCGYVGCTPYTSCKIIGF